MSKLVSWSLFFCLPCAAVRAEDAGNAKAREAVNQFVKAFRAKDARAMAKVTAVPFLDDKDSVVKGPEKLGKLLREKADKLALPEGAEVTAVVPYAEMRRELHDGARRKRVEEVLGKDGRIVLLTEKKHQWMRAVLVRVQDGKAVVVGGPHLFGYLMDNKIPEAARTLLEKAERLELLSLDPAFKKRGKPETGFHGWRILGRTVVKEPAARKKLVAALLKGVEESDGNARAASIPATASG